MSIAKYGGRQYYILTIYVHFVALPHMFKIFSFRHTHSFLQPCGNCSMVARSIGLYLVFVDPKEEVVMLALNICPSFDMFHQYESRY